MKLGLIVISMFIGLICGTSYALATTLHASVSNERPVVIPPQDKPVIVELPTDNVLSIPTVTIKGTPAKHVAVATAKTWQCGEMYTNSIGGRNQDCVWR